ncbi:uncharacterized protein LOC111340108 isoform X3 [Stylophora pistillata]|uniref:uncharacterized protein LOC111340108 isoform X3 n=1 Tax=Stylophora pistillata TaxID=50429 RepID=UPI000C04096C|nr:uncharacterized protein LOC111340108 isoform X3 [Stylophora pistillata]
MKVEGNARRGKKKGLRSLGTRKEGSLQSTDLVVTVPNEDSNSSRFKPPVTARQTRKIVINRKTESTELDNVTVKSLDEIMREKQERMKRTSTDTATNASHDLDHDAVNDEVSASSSPNAIDSADNVLNGAEIVASSTHESAVSTLSTKTKSSALSGHPLCAVKPRPPLKKLTVPIKALPGSLSPMENKTLSAKHPYSVASFSSKQSSEMDFDGLLNNNDDDEVDSCYDEDILLEDNEDEMHQDSPKTHNYPHNDEATFHPYMDYSDVPHKQDNAEEEEEDDEISLHPDDSLFDEEDDLGVNSDGIRTRGSVKRAGSESRDRRLPTNGTKQKQSQGSSSSPVKTKEELQTDETQEQDKNKEADKERSQHEQVSPRSRHRTNWSSTCKKDGRRTKRPSAGRGVTGVRKAGDSFSRRGGCRSRLGPRRERSVGVSGPVQPVLGVPGIPLFNTGDGLLPLPGTELMSPVLQPIWQAQAQLDAAMKDNIAKTVEMLVNPPPVPGENVPEYNSHGPPVQHASRASQESGKLPQRHQSKRSHNSGQDANHNRVSENSMCESRLQPKRASDRLSPRWFERMKDNSRSTNEQLSLSDGMTSQFRPVARTREVLKSESTPHAAEASYQHNAVLGDNQNNASNRSITEVEKARLAVLRPTHSPSMPDSDSDSQTSSKRKSPFHGEETLHGRKVLVTTSPDGLPQPNLAKSGTRKPYPKGYCFEQLNTGKCKKPKCKYKHMDYNQLQEVQWVPQVAITSSQGNDLEELPTVQTEEAEEEVPVASYNLIADQLTNNNLHVAWQMVEKLQRTNRPDLDLVRQILAMCSKHLEEPDIAAQVAHKAFDTIKRVSGQHHRHDYTELIRTLCHAGQYIRAYEMLDVMKRSNHMPTYEVFLDLIQASAKDPEWAFNLLHEIKQSGLLKSGICNDLILLGCKSGEHFVQKTWLLFQEALQCKVQLSSDAVSAMLHTLSQVNDWEKIMLVLPVFPLATPAVVLKGAVMTALQKPEWIEVVTRALGVTPARTLVELGSDVWNSLLEACCLEQGGNVSFAQNVCSLMLQNGIPLEPQSTDNCMSALCGVNKWIAALELFNKVKDDPKVLEQPHAIASGLVALSTALCKAGDSASMLTVLHFMLESWIKPEDSVLQSAIEILDKEKNYRGVLQLFHQLEAAKIVLPVNVYKQMISSLEKWVENPVASIQPYAVMRHIYLAKHSESNGNEDVPSLNSSKAESLSFSRECRYFSTPQGCRNGDNCQFIHYSQGNVNSASQGGITGQNNKAVNHTQPGNPFVYRDPCTFPAQAIGTDLFGPVHHQQHTAPRITPTKEGLHLGGPFSSKRLGPPVVSTTIENAASNFQLAATNQFTGTNPFSPCLSGRTRSMDGIINSSSTDQHNHQTRSAPVIPEVSPASYFQYPSKKSLQFYLPRIKHASEQNSWEDLGSVYVAMKNEDVDVDLGVLLKVFFESFEVNSVQTVGENFGKFCDKIHQHLKQTVPSSEPDSSPSASLDDDDKRFIGELGVAIMYLTYIKQLFDQGYSVLHVLHNFSINYAMYTGEFGVQKKPLTSCQVALTAADICLSISQPLHSSALEVLRGTNYACAADGTTLTPEETEWRRQVFVSLCEYFLNTKELAYVFELLDIAGDVGEVKALYNRLIRGLISKRELNDVTILFNSMEDKRISWEPSLVRELVKGFGEAGNVRQARFYFKKGMYTGVYHNSFSPVNPFTVTVGVSFSALECQLFIERHLHSLKECIDRQAESSGGNPLNDTDYGPLKVVVKLDVPSLYTRDKGSQPEEVIWAKLEEVRAVLNDEFNPPLSCTAQGKELLVSSLNLKRWFRANPKTGRFKGGSRSAAFSSVEM